MEKTTIGNAELWQGDVFAMLSALPSASVDLLLTDPPYSSGGMTTKDRIRSPHRKYVLSESASGNALPSFSGDCRDQVGYWFWVSLWLSEGLRLVKPGGIAGLFTDWRQLPVTVAALQAGGFIWRGILPWHKPGSRPTQGRFANACEYLAWGTAGPRPLTGATYPGFISCVTPNSKIRTHIAQKPEALMAALVAIAPPGGVVLDPFMGSGTTGVAALKSGRRFIGGEVDAGTFTDACEKLRIAQGLRLENRA